MKINIKNRLFILVPSIVLALIAGILISQTYNKPKVEFKEDDIIISEEKELEKELTLSEKIDYALSLTKKEDSIWPWKEEREHPCVDALVKMGKEAGHILISKLEEYPDDPWGEGDFRWREQQNITYALCKIYGVSELYGTTVYGNRVEESKNKQVYLFWKNYLEKEEHAEKEDVYKSFEDIYSSMIDMMNENINKDEFEYQDERVFLKFGNLFDPAKIHSVLIFSTLISEISDELHSNVCVFKKQDREWIELVRTGVYGVYGELEDMAEFSDYNGDDYPDFLVPVQWGATGNVWFCLWLYNPEVGNLDYIPEFENLSRPSFDTSSKILHSYGRGGCAGKEYVAIDYIWIEREIVPIKKVTQDCNEDGSLRLKIYERKNKEWILIKEEERIEPYYPPYWEEKWGHK